MSGDAVSKVFLTDEEGNGQLVVLDVGGSVIAFAGEGEVFRLAAVLVGLAIADLRTGVALSSTPGRASSQFDTFDVKAFGERVVLGGRGRDQREEDSQREHCRIIVVPVEYTVVLCGIATDRK